MKMFSFVCLFLKLVTELDRDSITLTKNLWVHHTKKHLMNIFMI